MWVFYPEQQKWINSKCLKNTCSNTSTITDRKDQKKAYEVNWNRNELLVSFQISSKDKHAPDNRFWFLFIWIFLKTEKPWSCDWFKFHLIEVTRSKSWNGMNIKGGFFCNSQYNQLFCKSCGHVHSSTFWTCCIHCGVTGCWSVLLMMAGYVNRSPAWVWPYIYRNTFSAGWLLVHVLCYGGTCASRCQVFFFLLCCLLLPRRRNYAFVLSYK